VIAILLRLYPAWWRTRYGDEFGALLESRNLGPFDVADVILAAIDAHLHLRDRTAVTGHLRGFLMSVRIGGIAAIVGGILFGTGFFWAAFDPADSDPGGVVALLSIIVLLVGLVGLSAHQARRHPAITWAAFAVPAIGTAIVLIGLLASVTDGDRVLAGDLSAWEVMMLGLFITFVGTALFAGVTLWTRAFAPIAAVILIFGSVLAPAALAGVTLGVMSGELVFAAGILGYSIGWIAMGVSAVREHGVAGATSG